MKKISANAWTPFYCPAEYSHDLPEAIHRFGWIIIATIMQCLSLRTRGACGGKRGVASPRYDMIRYDSWRALKIWRKGLVSFEVTSYGKKTTYWNKKVNVDMRLCPRCRHLVNSKKHNVGCVLLLPRTAPERSRLVSSRSFFLPPSDSLRVF